MKCSFWLAFDGSKVDLNSNKRFKTSASGTHSRSQHLICVHLRIPTVKNTSCTWKPDPAQCTLTLRVLRNERELSSSHEIELQSVPWQQNVLKQCLISGECFRFSRKNRPLSQEFRCSPPPSLRTTNKKRECTFIEEELEVGFVSRNWWYTGK